ncbi:M43 family zinc metalloprotease [Longitalea luteola]|uniref:M43 family zinc metalloprotease n=1 Tax=Longitalea luteola TaxID=2812563 RepID=UPI001A95E65C|nr:M43 family zinc metalloprotease [Longitalea luteola]
MMRKHLQNLIVGFTCTLGLATLQAQERCGTVPVMENNFKKNPALKSRYEIQSRNIQQAAGERKARQQALRIEAATMYIPVVFHIVLINQAWVTDEQIQQQLDQLNRDFGGLNPDSTRIPAAFKPLFAKTNIQFKLAQRTPANEPSNGINRVTTFQQDFDINDARVKYNSLGGADAWDNTRFFNVWITDLSGGYLGYATLPGNSIANEEGVVIRYTALPGGNNPYDIGRTLVHETGHYFGLQHIWGDENFCDVDDGIMDTPKQGKYTSGCWSGEKYDTCAKGSPGVMYQNFMDYTDDACMVMFTEEQKIRMETTASTYRASLLTSNGADPVIAFNLDASAKSITTPLQRICNPTFAPVITLRNNGAQTLTSATIVATLDGGVATTTTNWTGSLGSLRETAVTLNAFTVAAQGAHLLTVNISSPNGSTDENAANNTITINFLYTLPVAPPLTESFEGSVFPPGHWDLVNPDQNVTWSRTTAAAKTGTASAVIRNFEYPFNAQKDYLRLPVMNITSGDSAFMTFQVAAAVVTDPKDSVNAFDTLEVLLSKDCGATFTSLYKKGGSDLITRAAATPTSFVPNAAEWRKDSVNLTPYINDGPILLAFASTNQHENNIYLDDINVYSLTINPVLKTKGFMITPNPTTGMITVQFYPYPAFIKGINIFSSAGEKLASQRLNSTGSSGYTFDLSRYASGVYIVQVVLGDKVITQKVIKR